MRQAKRKLNKLKHYSQRIIALLVVIIWFLSGGAPILRYLNLPLNFWEANAASVTIDATSTTQDKYSNVSPTIVFTTDQIGYAFYIDSGNNAVYSKTSNGGSTWGAAVSVDAQTDVQHIEVWYDKWTPGDSGTMIHIVTWDSGNDDAWYNRLDTSSDTLLSAANAVPAVSSTPGPVKTNTINGGQNFGSITKGTDGVIYVGVIDNSGSWVLKCSSSCSSAANWSDAGFNDATLYESTTVNDSDTMGLVPLLGGDILMVLLQSTADDMVSYYYTASTATWGTKNTIDANAPDSTTYDAHFGITLDRQSGKVYVAYAADVSTQGTDDDIRVKVFDGISTWTSKTDVITNSSSDGVTSNNRGITGAKIAIDENSGDLYVVYTARSTPATATTGNVYYKVSTNEGSTWGTEQAAINTTAADILGMQINIMSNERLYATFSGNASGTLLGANVVDLTQPTSTYTQAAYRLFNNNNSTDVGTALAAANTAGTLTTSGGSFRLRLLIKVATAQLNQNAGAFQLQFAAKGGGTCASPSGTYTAVTTSSAIAFYNNTTPTDNSALTANANDPTNGADTIVNQTYEEENFFKNTQAAIPSGQDGKWDFSLYDFSAVANTAYCFRAVTFNGTVLGTYSQYPEITTAAASTFDQSAYRFFAANNGVSVSSTLAAQDTAATLTSPEQQFRLRMLIHVGTTNVGQGGRNFKLQYAGKGAGTCASPSGSPSTYTDITTTTGIAYFDNTTPADGAALTTNASDPTHSSDTVQAQTYEESNNFSNSQSAINAGQDGKWDFSLTDLNTPTNTTYCIRAVRVTGAASSTALDTYTQYAQVTTSAVVSNSIDVSANGTTTKHQGSPQTVFTTDQIGYVFYVDNDGSGAYKKTTDGGTNWSASMVFDQQTDVQHIGVWYDQWTPGDTTGTVIHIVTDDSSTNVLWYTKLDTASDTLTNTVNAASSQGGSFGVTNIPTITKATDGALYMAVSDASDQYVIKCTTTCDTGSNWTEVGTNPMSDSLLDNFVILMPLAGGNVMLIRETTAGALAYKNWNGTTWDAAWTSIDAATAVGTTFLAPFGATVNRVTNDIYLAYTGDNSTLGTDDDIRTAVYTGSSWTAKTNVLTNDSKGVMEAKIAINENNADIYVVYSARTTAATATTGNIYYKKSTDGMGTWGTESSALNAAAGDIHGPSVNIMSTDRLYVRWFVNTANDINGTLVANLTPASYNEAAYKFFTNANSTDVGAQLQSQDTKIILAPEATTFRLRMLLDIGGDGAQKNLNTLKLQFAQKSGTCDTAFSGETYADVTTGTAISYNDNATPTDGSALTNNSNDPSYSGHTIVNQSYEELNNFSNNIAALPTGQAGKWDFSLKTNGAVAGTGYCLRVVKSGGTALDTYTVVPEVIASPSNAQLMKHGKFFDVGGNKQPYTF